MADVVDPRTRSRMMAGIKGKDTRPELVIRSALHKAGFRFRLHDKRLPGSPDLVLSKYCTVIFIHGCFWHRHAGCKYASIPATRPEFWQKKFKENVERDERNRKQLLDDGWRVFTIWECSIRHDLDYVMTQLDRGLKSGSESSLEIARLPSKYKQAD